jgi:hypothetical protein
MLALHAEYIVRVRTIRNIANAKARFFGDLANGALFYGLPILQVAPGRGPGARPMGAGALSEKDATIPHDKHADADAGSVRLRIKPHFAARV